MAEMKLDYLGKYRVIDEIGHGRFSIVYRAEHPLLKKMVAVKLMLPTLFNNPELIQRFTHEASAAAAIKHENIAQVIDLVEEKDRLFMVMEYMPAGNLHDFAQKHGRLNFRQIAHIISDIAAALDFAHNQGSVHGDIKPGNILLTDDGNARLTDFGILRAVETAGVTSSELTRGTPHYISPEQAEGEHPTRFSDQYALGVVAYELFTGKVPFDGNTPLAIYLKHVRETVPPASQSNPLITTRLDAIINQALAKEPSKRFPDCGTFARALSQSLTATESKQYQDLATQASAALKAYDPKTARPLIEAAMQIASDEASSRTLLEKLQASEQIQQSYANARKSLAAARAMASKLRSAKNHPADPQG
ncbi:MAG: serine/threonine-protein kinase, partial [Chloroflexi bacterium]|nr:serine/threonine-protein kinase [Chloroflexota bacterium]